MIEFITWGVITYFFPTLGLMLGGLYIVALILNNIYEGIVE